MSTRDEGLGRRLGLSFLKATALFLALAGAVLALVAGGRFRRLEDEASRDQARRARAAAAAELSSLADLAREYGAWDETLAFVRGRERGYVERNFAPAWLEAAELALVALYGASGEPLYAAAVAPGGELVEPPPAVADGLRALAPRAGAAPLPRAGWIELPTGPGIFAFHPATSSDFSEPAAGGVLLARAFAGAPLSRLAERIEAPAALAPRVAGPDRPGARPRPWRPLGGGDAVLDEGDDREIAVSLGGGGPTLLVRQTKTIEAAGRRAVAEILAALAAACGAAYAILLRGVRRLVVAPLASITSHVDAAMAGGEWEPLAMGQAAGRRDEIGILADHADALLAADAAKRAELAELAAELARRASTDHLTGLANRRSLDERFEAETRRIRRERRREDASDMIAVALGDIDFFKAFNDRYGHSAGDACLRAVADAMRGALRRPADFACRYGGEEFAVVLPRTDLAGAAVVAEAIRAAVEDMAIPHGGSAVAACVTISLGVAAARADAEDFDRSALFEAADAALYRAKEAGRNRVDPPIGGGTGGPA